MSSAFERRWAYHMTLKERNAAKPAKPGLTKEAVRKRVTVTKTNSALKRRLEYNRKRRENERKRGTAAVKSGQGVSNLTHSLRQSNDLNNILQDLSVVTSLDRKTNHNVNVMMKSKNLKQFAVAPPEKQIPEVIQTAAYVEKVANDSRYVDPGTKQIVHSIMKRLKQIRLTGHTAARMMIAVLMLIALVHSAAAGAR